MVLEVARQALQQYYGYDDFRPAQKPVVEHLLSGQDCLAIMPTGAGKSICFQIPAAVRQGLTLVFSPLISLMKDQVDGLAQVQLPATYLNSTLTSEEVRERMRGLRDNRYKLLYLAPERLASESFCDFLRALPIAQVIIDEAHCVSQWGHDFRPSYRNIAPFIQTLRRKPIVGALTATATKEVEEDILQLLGLASAKVFKLGFDRPNLSFHVRHSSKRLQDTIDYVRSKEGESGVVYCITRKDVESVYQALIKAGIPAGFYHAGLSDEIRQREQERYANDEIQVMVATNAFGMGIDKSNVRFVLHYQMPRNMEGYYQEAGRAGRDGGAAECILLYNAQDIRIHRFLIEQSSEDPARRQIEMERLQEMTDYCFSTICLRRFILQYFGERVQQLQCHNCSVCEHGEATEDRTKEALAVFRVIEMTESRFGYGMLVSILLGQVTDRIRRLGYQNSPLFGSLKHMGERGLRDFLHMLQVGGYLTQTTGQYPLVRMTEKAEYALLGMAPVVHAKVQVITQRRETPQRRAAERGVAHSRDSLFERLRQVRKEIAAEYHIRPYHVCSDTVLIDMAALRPKTLADLAQVRGLGANRIQKYGMRFLSVLAEVE